MGIRVFLTGASGYLGGVLAEHLSRLPEVDGITGIGLRDPPAALPAKLKFVSLDIRSPRLAAVMAGHEVVIHTACVVFWSAKMPARERDDINLNGLENVARATLATGARRFIHASSMAVYDPYLAQGRSDIDEDFPKGKPDRFLYYWSTKAAAEKRLGEIVGGSSLVLTMFRPIYIIGPRNRATMNAMRRNAINFPRRDPRRQFVHEDDVAAAFIQAARSDLPGSFNVVPDDFLHMSEVWSIIGRGSVPTVPLWAARLLTWIRWRFLGSPIHPSWVADMLVNFTGSNAKLKAAGWTPHYNSAEALRSAVRISD